MRRNTPPSAGFRRWDRRESPKPRPNPPRPARCSSCTSVHLAIRGRLEHVVVRLAAGLAHARFGRWRVLLSPSLHAPLNAAPASVVAVLPYGRRSLGFLSPHPALRAGVNDAWTPRCRFVAAMLPRRCRSDPVKPTVRIRARSALRHVIGPRALRGRGGSSGTARPPRQRAAIRHGLDPAARGFAATSRRRSGIEEKPCRSHRREAPASNRQRTDNWPTPIRSLGRMRPHVATTQRIRAEAATSTPGRRPGPQTPRDHEAPRDGGADVAPVARDGPLAARLDGSRPVPATRALRVGRAVAVELARRLAERSEAQQGRSPCSSIGPGRGRALPLSRPRYRCSRAAYGAPLECHH